MSTKVDWKDAGESWPESEGVYLTFWSDGALETYAFDESDIQRKSISICGQSLLFWAENVQPPKL